MQQQRIIIVGAGIIGLSTAYALLQHGMQDVTVLEQARVGHERAASSGLSRLLRFEYGDDLFYSEMVNLSLQRWKQLEQATSNMIYTPTGILMLGNEHNDVSMNSYYTLCRLGLTPECLTHTSCMQRFPQFDLQKYNVFIYNPNAGMLHASSILHTLRACILELGGSILEGQKVRRIYNEDQAHAIRLQLTSGDEIAADRVVVAVGSWIHQLLPSLQLPVRLTRQSLLYFANLPASIFGLPAFPAFMADDLYGFPLHGTCADGHGPLWLKAASHSFGPTSDPAASTLLVDEKEVQQTVEELRALLPALRQAELIKIESYIYDVSQDEDFILDYLPGNPRIVFASGLSGHAFKFGLLLGEVLGSLVREAEPVIPIERFRLGRFARQLQGSVA